MAVRNCINANCSIVATVHHVQVLAGRTMLRASGGHTKKVLSPTGDGDPDETTIPIAKSQRTVTCNIAKDISFVYTEKPIAHKSGLPHSYKFNVGQKVQVAGYRDGKFETKSALIIGANVRLLVGATLVNDNMILDIPLDPGDSGSAVIDERGALIRNDRTYWNSQVPKGGFGCFCCTAAQDHCGRIDES